MNWDFACAASAFMVVGAFGISGLAKRALVEDVKPLLGALGLACAALVYWSLVVVDPGAEQLADEMMLLVSMGLLLCVLRRHFDPNIVWGVFLTAIIVKSGGHLSGFVPWWSEGVLSLTVAIFGLDCVLDARSRGCSVPVQVTIGVSTLLYGYFLLDHALPWIDTESHWMAWARHPFVGAIAASHIRWRRESGDRTG